MEEQENSFPTPGEIQILNSCGIPKVAGQLRTLLIAQGFDVVEVGNDNYWNYEETLVALRNPHWPGAKKLAKILKTDNIIPLENPLKMVDATIYVGKDIHKVLDYDKR
ncbi:MAG: LytR C-terminal domain-containing protein [Fibrobacter sp.]|mgnify:CR=1 FL=1|nr:LytR C-terminal domain-containing protein [Fibrobacter sp.]